MPPWTAIAKNRTGMTVAAVAKNVLLNGGGAGAACARDMRLMPVSILAIRALVAPTPIAWAGWRERGRDYLPSIFRPVSALCARFAILAR